MLDTVVSVFGFGYSIFNSLLILIFLCPLTDCHSINLFCDYSSLSSNRHYFSTLTTATIFISYCHRSIILYCISPVLFQQSHAGNYIGLVYLLLQSLINIIQPRKSQSNQGLIKLIHPVHFQSKDLGTTEFAWCLYGAPSHRGITWTSIPLASCSTFSRNAPAFHLLSSAAPLPFHHPKTHQQAPYSSCSSPKGHRETRMPSPLLGNWVCM